MLICHCNVITKKEIEDTIVELLDEGAWQLIVPAKVYHRLHKRGRCCSCFPDVVEAIIRVTEAYHAVDAPAQADAILHLDRVRQLRVKAGVGAR
jgi:BFD-like [2Fe-2S] binding domain